MKHLLSRCIGNPSVIVSSKLNVNLCAAKMASICPAALLNEIVSICDLPQPKYEFYYYPESEEYRCTVKIFNLKHFGHGKTVEEAKMNGAHNFIMKLLPKVNDSDCMRQLSMLAKICKADQPEYSKTQASALKNLVKCSFLEVETEGIGPNVEAAKQHAAALILENIKINGNTISLEKETVTVKKEFRQVINGNPCFKITRKIPDVEIDNIQVRSDLDNIFKEFNISYDLESYDFFAHFVGKNCPISRNGSGISREDAEMRVLKCAIKAIMKLSE